MNKSRLKVLRRVKEQYQKVVKSDDRLVFYSSNTYWDQRHDARNVEWFNSVKPAFQVSDMLYSLDCKGRGIIYSSTDPNNNLLTRLINEFTKIQDPECSLLDLDEDEFIDAFDNDLRLLDILTLGQCYSFRTSHGFVMDIAREIDYWYAVNPNDLEDMYNELKCIIEKHLGPAEFNVEKCKTQLMHLLAKVVAITYNYNDFY